MGAGAAWGASSAEWGHFDLVLGLTEELLPVVSNPNAEISPNSKIGTPGKLPSHYNGDGKMAGIAAWTSKQTTPNDITRWARNPDYGICLQTRRIRAIDVDVEDFDQSMDIEDTIAAFLHNDLPCRRRPDSCKFLLAFDMPGDFTKRILKTAHGAIEFLATGQQFIAIGTHPKGSRYEWPGGLPDTFPTLSAERFEELWALLCARFGTETSVTVRQGITPEKRRALADIDDPMVDWLEANWDVHDIDRSGRVDIRCPFEAGHSTDSGASSTSYFPAGVGGFEVGHFRCLHASCAHRKDQDFKNEIGYNADGFDVIEVLDAGTSVVPAWQTQVPSPVADVFSANLSPRSGKIKAVRMSVTTALEWPVMCGFEVRLDVFRDEIMIAEKPGQWRTFRDQDYHGIALKLENGNPAFEHIPSEMVRAATQFVACKAEFDSAIAWINTLKWDGVPRIEKFWSRYMRAEDTPYTRAVSLYTWTALAGRVLVPGVKADMAPVAVGAQGAMKSSAIEAMVPNTVYHGELDLAKPDDDLARSIRGKLLMEIGELRGVAQRQVEHLKAFMSRREDKWTPKYKEYQTSYARRCLFIGSTNDEEALPPDVTGQRRWLPVDILPNAQCDIAGIVDDRDQLWAEGMVLFQKSGVAWQSAEKLARPLHDQYQAEDVWVSRIHEWAFTADDFDGGVSPAKRGPMQLNEIASCALGIPVRDVTMLVSKRIAQCLTKLGFRKTTKDGHKAWAFDFHK